MKKNQFYTKNSFVLACMVCAVMIVVSYSQLFAQIQAKIVATKSQIQSFLGTANAKLVFSNGSIKDSQGKLYFVDFNDATPQIKEVGNAANGAIASISQDGQNVAYAAGVTSDGVGGAGKVWVSSLAENATPLLVADPGFEPRFVQNASKLTVIYTTQGGGNLHLGVGKTVKREITGTTVGSEITVFDGGGYVGGLSWDNRYLATGFREGRIVDLQDPQKESKRIHELAFKNTTTQKDSTFLLQVCNSSVSSSRSLYANHMMYIDFGFFKTGYAHEVIAGGQKWGLHAIIFVSDYNNTLKRYIDTPPQPLGPNSGDITRFHWDDPEWSNHPYFAAANVQNDRSYDMNPNPHPDSTNWKNTSIHENIYLIDLRTSTYLKVIETTDITDSSKTDMQWPWLWVEVPAGFSEQSGWLDAPNAIPFLNNQKQQENKYNIRFALDKIVADVPITQVKMYTTTGMNIRTIRPQTNVLSVALPELKHVSEGVYFFSIETAHSQVVLSKVIVR